MTGGIEVWEIWKTPEMDEALLRQERDRLFVQAAAPAQSLLKATSALLPPPLPGMGFQHYNLLSEQLIKGGWKREGHLRIENLAASHFEAAVLRAEESAIEEARSNQERENAEGKGFPDWALGPFFAEHALDRATGASRTAVILATASLEAFINEAASSVPNWGEEEDKMPLKAKWILVPTLLTGRSFERANQPFQDFSRLVSLRNQLVHSKTKKERFTGDRSFLQALDSPSKLDVGPREGRRACITARRMILGFCRLAKQDPPPWCVYVPEAEASDLDAWSKAIILAGVRADSAYPPILSDSGT